MKMSQFREQSRQWQYLVILLLVLGMLFAACPAYCSDYFVAPDGNDLNDGSIDYPFRTVGRAHVEAEAGDTIFLRGGVHEYSETIWIYKDGEAGNPITLQAYQDEVPILDFNEQEVGGTNFGIFLYADYWHLKGFIIQNAGDNGLQVNGYVEGEPYSTGSHNILERLVARYNSDSGIQLDEASSYNLVINCDSYLNYDAGNHGANADGFAAKEHVGEGNTFVGCRAWNNSDDGWDLWQAGSGVTLENCWTFWNGVNVWGDSGFQGDGNGFKLGGGEGAHILKWCVAYENMADGITDNGNSTGILVYNCTSVNNNWWNFYFEESSGGAHVLRNNLSYMWWQWVHSSNVDEYNSWNYEDEYGWTVTAADFVSLDDTGIDSPRGPDGGLPNLSFLHLARDSWLIDAGIDVGLAFDGDAPDLGAFELLDGDCEADGDIDLYDFAYLASNWRDVGCGDCDGADFDGDSDVDLYDLAKMAGNWLKY